MRRGVFFLLVIVILSAVFAVEVEEVRKQAQQKTDSVRSESQKKVEKILARFAEFKADLEKLKPGLDIALPVDTKNAGKLRLVDHNELTGIPEAPKVFAIVTQDYRLKTWHSDSDSQNLDRVRAGDKVEVVMVVNPRGGGLVWALIRTASESEGYIPQQYLKNVPEQLQPSTKKKEAKYNISSSGLRMRSEPSLAGEFIQLVPAEAEVEVTGYSAQKDTIDGLTDFWAQANYAGKRGWLFNGYLRPVSQKIAPQPPQVGAGGFAMPVDGRVNSKFGPRIDPVTKKSGDFHRGIDIMAPIGEPIKSAKTGEIYENSANRWWGNYIIIKHSDNLFTYYCHQSRTKARKGQQVAAGELIGYVGKTGKATGPHLHFEVRVGKDPKDPLQYLK
jgi:murein DD-endopeptidase MepM/ murein hydrolase activator NlpD